MSISHDKLLSTAVYKNRLTLNNSNMLDIESTVNDLAKLYPYFHNEKSFQFNLALLLKNKYLIELEHFCEIVDSKRSYIDLIVYDEETNECHLIELKFKTKISKEAESNGYFYFDQGAQDWGVYSVVNDISRLEKYSKKHETINFNNKEYKIKSISSILLTNDSKYQKGWKPGRLFYNYSLKEGVTLKNKLRFVIPTGKKKSDTCAKNFDEVELMYQYTINWKKYSNEFDYVILNKEF